MFIAVPKETDGDSLILHIQPARFLRETLVKKDFAYAGKALWCNFLMCFIVILLKFGLALRVLEDWEVLACHGCHGPHFVCQGDVYFRVRRFETYGRLSRRGSIAALIECGESCWIFLVAEVLSVQLVRKLKIVKGVDGEMMWNVWPGWDRMFFFIASD